MAGLLQRTTLPRDIGWIVFFAGIACCWLALAWLSLPPELPAPPASTLLGWFDRSLDGALWRSLCSANVRDAGSMLVIAMWALMTLAMMLPTAVPMLTAHRQIATARNPGAIGETVIFGLGYAVVWLGFALAMALLQIALSGALVEADGVVRSGWLAAGLLALAGLYQFSALKAACMAQCHAPMTYFMGRWRGGARGALEMGLHHGMVCLGCCWALMLLAFVGGTMNVGWMGLATLLMIFEKLPAIGRHVTRPLGAALLAAAALAAAMTLELI